MKSWSTKALGTLRRFRSRLPQESWILFTGLGVALTGWGFAFLTGHVMAGRTQTFDDRVLLALRRADDLAVPVGPSWGQGFALEFTSLGSAIVLLTVILLVAGYLALERRYGMMWLTLGATIGGMLLSEALKGVFGRDRPTVVPHLAVVESTSFPSGHSMISAVVYLTLGTLLARSTRDWRLRSYYLGAAMALTVLVGLSRVYLGVHYPTDVLAGWTAGAVWAIGCDLGAQALQRRGALKRSPAPAPASS